jgi:hypothetical protein
MKPFEDSTMAWIDAFRAKVAFLDPHLERPRAGQGKADFWARGLLGGMNGKPFTASHTRSVAEV